MADTFWMGPYEPINLLGLFIQSIFVENFIFANFLGMCSFLSCSSKIKTANGLGMAVIFVITVSGILNWFLHRYVTAPGALAWLNAYGINGAAIDLSFLEFLIFISIIAGFTQITEIVVESASPALYRALGIFLPLIAVNCAVLGVTLFMVIREYPLIPSVVYVFGSSLGWWLAIVLMAAIREKLSYSKLPKGLEGMGITFAMGGLMAFGFMGFGGMNFSRPTGGEKIPPATEQNQPLVKNDAYPSSADYQVSLLRHR
jgi:Na+-transporting NADH:ubiquinone oxidoreductase subunit E